jgi:hypothetical protein
MGSLSDLVLRPGSESALEKAEANRRLGLLTEDLYRVTEPSANV